jgi:MSHA biogenesis protein MshK
MKHIGIAYPSAICLTVLLLSATAVCPSETRNPFEYGKKVQKKIKAGDSLEVILISGEEKIAVIGGKEYSVGDKLGEFMVMTIDIDYVEIASSAKTKRLYLNDQL